MATDFNFEFFVLPMTKALLKFKDGDESEDALLMGSIGLRSERWVKNRLIAHSDSFPLDTEDQESAISAACNKAAELYKKHNNNTQGAKDFREAADDDMESLLIALRARPTARNKIEVASQTYDTEQDTLFSQVLR